MKGLGFKHGMALSTAVLMVALAGCSTSANTNHSSSANSSTSSSNAGSSTNTAAPDTSAKKPVTITWWHSMSGTNQKVLEKIVSDFNASQSDVQVQAVFQGKYDESLNKLKATIGSDSGPDLIQTYEIGSKFMIDSKLITPVQNFVDADHFDLSQLEPNIIRYYTIGGKLNAMPFNTSNPILYYNKTAFKAAGLDPEKPPKTYEEFEKAAKALSKNGKPGASIAIYGWFMEQFFANQNADYVNNGNGRTDTATESLVNSEAGVKTLEWWKRMLDEGAVSNLGRKTEDTDNAFMAGQIGMTIDSTAGLRQIVQGVGGKFDVGTGFLPRPASADKGGVVVGGASLYIMNNKPEDEQKAAWTFIKYLTSPQVQAEWSVNTGYFPITKGAYDQQVLKDNMTKYPQFQTAVDQLHASTDSTATSGAVMGVFPEARQIVEGAIEATLNGQKQPKQALDEAAQQITQKIGDYNKTVQK